MSDEPAQHWNFTFTSDDGGVEVHSGQELARSGKLLVAELLDHVDDQDYIRQALSFFLAVEEVPARLLLSGALEVLVGTLMRDTVENWPPFRRVTELMADAMRRSAELDADQESGAS